MDFPADFVVPFGCMIAMHMSRQFPTQILRALGTYVYIYIYICAHTHTHFQPALHDIVAGLVAKVGGLRAGCLLGLSRSEICRALGLRV